MPVLLPKKELKLPSVLFAPASRPKKEFWKPVVFARPALLPKNELLLPPVLARPAPPSLRRKLPAAPGEINPVPPCAAGTTPSEMLGVVVGFVTETGPSALTLVTVPPPFPSSPLCATIVQSSPSTGVTFVLARFA